MWHFSSKSCQQITNLTIVSKIYERWQFSVVSHKSTTYMMDSKMFWSRFFIHYYVSSISSLTRTYSKVKKVQEGSLDLISSPPPSVKIQIMGRKVCLRCKGKILLGVVNKLLKTKSLLTSPSNVLPIIWIFTEGDGIESTLSS